MGDITTDEATVASTDAPPVVDWEKEARRWMRRNDGAVRAAQEAARHNGELLAEIEVLKKRLASALANEQQARATMTQAITEANATQQSNAEEIEKLRVKVRALGGSLED